LALGSSVLCPIAHALVPPPDGGYPGGNTAEGTQALNSIILPVPVRGGELGALRNTANGYQTLFSLTTSSDNTAAGYQALFNITIGNGNTAMGAGALIGLGTGSNNTAVGFNANTNGSNLDNNTIVGANASGGALETTVIGANAQAGFQQNAVVGFKANGGDSGNTVIGAFAGSNLKIGSFGVICIGQAAGTNLASPFNVISIGAAGQNVDNSCYIGNIWNQPGGSQAVYVNSDGKLGFQSSSRRFKDEIKPMECASEVIYELKPVRFRYKPEIEPTCPRGFGLIAEDVQKINPDLVVHDAEGKPASVRYDAVNAMLLNEFLKEHRTVEELKSVAASQQATIAKQQKQIEALTAGFQKVSAQLEMNKPTPQLVDTSSVN
jgi:trimeric autotransporter adhesin